MPTGDQATTATRMTELSGHAQAWLQDTGMNPWVATMTIRAAWLAVTLLLAWVAYVVARRVLLARVLRLVKRTRAKWDDALLRRGVFDRLAHLAPAVIIYHLGGAVVEGLPTAKAVVAGVATIYMVVVVLLAVDSVLNAVQDLYRLAALKRDIPLRIIVQVCKLVVFCIGAVVIFSLVLDKSPVVLLSGLGAMTAVLLLIFRDSILGFVAGIQLSANQMVRIGDWIEMPKYGADGDVIEVTLTTVKVQNWDKTVTTIPTYALIGDSFKNWRGMQEAGGRRIKRALTIDMTTIRFLTGQDVERFKRFRLLKQYLADKEKEIAEWNAGLGGEEPLNSRRMTNIGTFRAYVVNYLKSNPKIHRDMTFLVRQLAPGRDGLPLEIYVFTNDIRWAEYEAIQSDIFDHLLAMVGEFGLKVFQEPSGHDFQMLRAGAGDGSDG